MTKNTGAIRRDRLQRVFVGTHSEKIVGKENWHEVGHWIQGFELRINRITETDGELNEYGRGLGFRITGQGEPAQNTIDDYLFYTSVLNGKRNVAILTGQLLRVFRLQYLGAKLWRDNRISIVTDEGYGSPMDKAYTRFSGLITTYERYYVDDVKIVSGKLTFKNLGRKADGNVTTADAFIENPKN